MVKLWGVRRTKVLIGAIIIDVIVVNLLAGTFNLSNVRTELSGIVIVGNILVSLWADWVYHGNIRS